ncbi:MAG: RNA polymerase sigma-70 factor [Prolixibacteraceae bacterium]|jgi:RNA polymerase sigma-70 factor, ECF subfamily|nr:RNA polymerase sigma-70 factor [Prolixibacteraceae bacterium]MBT6004589.1 RNA polymerase sigma-70 factor [Prolixibacteraceae bacterium]MBT6766249.1 RNA polymerase sigma-70 factor [Prolixibacteraceae bacterium]MBT7000579.1 RNA polymerase sigma-70 factor [Prolixibacteraceae bacterium]MBT7393527.1 RNA polymerase sigma-70 factor [Prolixibacteraceae bacterium]
MNLEEEKVLFEKIRNDNKIAFEKLFHKYYGHLCLFASRILQDDIAAEEIVQDFFVKLWEKRKQIFIETSVKSYLYNSIKNLCYNFIKHNKIKFNHAQSVLSDAENNKALENNFAEINLLEKIEDSIQSLPEKRREIFRMSREEGLKYREIANKLNISIKTVETQMGLAIKTLREKLKNYNPFFTLFFF